MKPTPVPVLVSVPGVRLRVTYSFHEALHPASDRVIVLHHGICHTRETFLRLIEELNRLGLHAAMIDQQSEGAESRNCISLDQYVKGQAAAARMIEKDIGLRIGTYVFHSMGALMGEEMQQSNPDLRRPTVLMAPIPVCGAWPITWRIMKRNPRSYVKALVNRDVHSLMDTPDEVRELFFDRDTPQELVDETTEQLKHAPFWTYCQLVLRPFVRPKIHNDEHAKLLLFSETDEIFHAEEYQRTRTLYQPLEEYVIPGGHDFFMRDAELTARRIADFHKRHNTTVIHGSHETPGHHFAHRSDEAKSVEREQTIKCEEK